MKPEKLVTMHCPSCGADFGKQLIIMVDPLKKESHLGERLPKKCRFCGTNLVRSVTKVKTIFRLGKLYGENKSNVSIPAQHDA